MGQFLRRQVVLECVQPSKNHNKFYEMNIYEQDSEGVYKLQCRWGRIEHFENGNPQSQVKISSCSWAGAEGELSEIMFAKLKKGYKVVKDHGKGSSKQLAAAEYHSKSIAKRVEIQKGNAVPEFERTEHIEVAQSDWWKTGHENIEERVV